jgi:hypothetical protein
VTDEPKSLSVFCLRAVTPAKRTSLHTELLSKNKELNLWRGRERTAAISFACD